MLVNMTDFYVGSNSLGLTISQYNNPFCIIDSGTTEILLFTTVYNQFYTQMTSI